MTKEYKSPVTMQVYLGCGEEGKQLRKNIRKASAKKSVSAFVLELLRKAEPDLFKGIGQGDK